MAKKDVVAIVYVGNKLLSSDNVARSGKQWNGFGDVQEVTPSQAAILLRYPDQWATFDPKNPPTRESASATSVQLLTKTHNELASQRSAAGPDGARLEDMDETELLVHAEKLYDITIDANLSKEEMRAIIEREVAQREQDAREQMSKDDQQP